MYSSSPLGYVPYVLAELKYFKLRKTYLSTWKRLIQHDSHWISYESSRVKAELRLEAGTTSARCVASGCKKIRAKHTSFQSSGKREYLLRDQTNLPGTSVSRIDLGAEFWMVDTQAMIAPAPLTLSSKSLPKSLLAMLHRTCNRSCF